MTGAASNLPASQRMEVGACFMASLHAGCAVTAGAAVGLDVEETQRCTHGDLLRLARRRFSPAEFASLKGRSPHGTQHPLCLCITQHCQSPTSMHNVQEHTI